LTAFSDSTVREIWYCASEQSGKTMTLTNCLAWSVEQLSGDIFYLMPGEEAAKNIVDQLLRPMFEKSAHLRGFLSDRKDDTANTRIRLRNGKIIRPSWATSALSMATFPAQAIFCDEVDKYVLQSGASTVDKESSAQKKETDPITLIRKRSRTFRGREKHFFCSTPAGRYVRKGIDACHQVWEWRLRCPHCQELIRPEGEHLQVDEAATIETIERDGVTMACHACGAEINEQQRIQAIRGGAWWAIKGADAVRPERVGFIHRAWDCLDVTLREIGVAWLKNLAGKLTDKIAWKNGIEADDYRHEQQDRLEDRILGLVNPSMPRGVVPADPATLLLLVDTQKYGFRYQVWAVGYGDHPSIHVVDRGFVHKFSDLENLANKDWQDAQGVVYRVEAGWIDSGGGTDPHRPKHSRTQAVYLFCKRNPIFNPIKGRRDQAQPWNLSRIEYLPGGNGKKIAIPGGLSLYTLNVTLYKGELATALEIEAGDPGSINLHADLGMDYARQMCAEYQDDRGYWICPRGKDNHDWDISVYGFAAIDIMHIRDRQPEPNEVPQIVHQKSSRRRMW
jgi:phage terminase large subunit GpA-like protein